MLEGFQRIQGLFLRTLVGSILGGIRTPINRVDTHINPAVAFVDFVSKAFAVLQESIKPFPAAMHSLIHNDLPVDRSTVVRHVEDAHDKRTEDGGIECVAVDEAVVVSSIKFIDELISEQELRVVFDEELSGHVVRTAFEFPEAVLALEIHFFVVMDDFAGENLEYSGDLLPVDNLSMAIVEGMFEHVVLGVVAVCTAVAAFDSTEENIPLVPWVDSIFLAVNNKLGLRAARDLYSAVPEELMLEKGAISGSKIFIAGVNIAVRGPELFMVALWVHLQSELYSNVERSWIEVVDFIDS